jgi:phenylacetate-CoA ligase
VVTETGDIDNIALKIELLPGCEAEIDVLRGKLIRELRVKTDLRYDLEFCRYGSLPRYKTKAKRFRDLCK